MFKMEPYKNKNKNNKNKYHGLSWNAFKNKKKNLFKNCFIGF